MHNEHDNHYELNNLLIFDHLLVHVLNKSDEVENSLTQGFFGLTIFDLININESKELIKLKSIKYKS